MMQPYLQLFSRNISRHAQVCAGWMQIRCLLLVPSTRQQHAPLVRLCAPANSPPQSHSPAPVGTAPATLTSTAKPPTERERERERKRGPNGGGSGVRRTDSSGQERIYHTPRNGQSSETTGSGIRRLDSKGHELQFHTPRASVVEHSASARSFESASSHSQPTSPQHVVVRMADDTAVGTGDPEQPGGKHAVGSDTVSDQKRPFQEPDGVPLTPLMAVKQPVFCWTWHAWVLALIGIGTLLTF